jgi:hypothetical protein
MNPDFINRAIGETFYPDAMALAKQIGDMGQHFKDHLIMGGRYNDKVGAEITDRLASLVLLDADEDHQKYGGKRYPKELSERRLVLMLDTANSLFEQGLLSSPYVIYQSKTKLIDMPLGCFLVHERSALNQIFDATRAKVNPEAEVPLGSPERREMQENADYRFTYQLSLETIRYCLATAKELAQKYGEPQFVVRGSGGMPDAIPRPKHQGCGCTCLVLLIGIIAAGVYFATNT